MPVEPAALVAVCPQCGALMKHLSDLPTLLGKSPKRVFRCYGCNHVTAAPF